MARRSRYPLRIPTMSALSIDQQLELIYIGYYDRAADGAGFNFWVGQNSTAQSGGQSKEVALSNIANSFGNPSQTETVAKYPFLNTATPNYTSPIVLAQLSAFIDAIYQNLFNHAPDVAGKAYWTTQITTGAFTTAKAILAIANGATGTDATILQNKITVAQDFTQKTSIAGLGFPANATFLAQAETVLNGVTEVASTVTAAQALTTAFAAGGGGSGTTFTMTAGADAGQAFTGGASGDTFNAADIGVNAAWTAGDAIDGGAGNDVFNIVSAALVKNPVGATVKNIETMNVTSGTTDTDLDTASFTGLTALNVTGIGSVTAKAAATTAVAVTDDTLAGGSVTVNGGSTVNVTTTGQGTISVGATTAAAGAVTVAATTSLADVAVGATTATGAGVTVKGGSIFKAECEPPG